MTNPTRSATRFRTTVTRRVIGALAGLALAGGLAAGPAWAAAAATTRASANVRPGIVSATALVDTLDDGQVTALFDGIPNAPGTGLRLGDLTAEQRDATYALLRSLLSAEAWTQVADLVEADTAVGASDDYHVALFGDPAGDFVLQFSTAELSLNAIRQGDTLDVQPDLVG
jgi:hypothetical protein